MEGKRCHFTGCNVQDFLPFRCDICNFDYCLAHRSQYVHTCVASKDTPRGIGERDQLVIDLFASVENRFKDYSTFNPKEHYRVKSSMIPSQNSTQDAFCAKIDDLNSASVKNKNVASKTKEILIKLKSKGNTNICDEDRLYLTLIFKATNQTIHAFFSKNITIGEVLQLISENYTLLSYGTPIAPSDVSLVFEINDISDNNENPTVPWYSFNHSSRINEVISNFESVNVITMKTMDIVRNQQMIQERCQNKSCQKEDNQQSQAVVTTKVLSDTPVAPVIPTLYFRQYKVGDAINYLVFNNETSISLKPGIVVAIHDDIPFDNIAMTMLHTTEICEKPNKYVTIKLEETGHDRQTTLSRIRGREEVHSGEMSQYEEGKCDVSEYEGSRGGGAIRISFTGKISVINGINFQGTLYALKLVICDHFKISYNNISKLIYKGKTLANKNESNKVTSNKTKNQNAIIESDKAIYLDRNLNVSLDENSLLLLTIYK